MRVAQGMAGDGVDGGADGGDGFQVEYEDGWTEDSFESRPIARSDLALSTITGAISKCKEVIERVEDGLDRTLEAAKAVEDASPDDDLLDKLQLQFLLSLDKLRLVQNKAEALTELHTRLRQNHVLENVTKLYTEASDAKDREYIEKTERARFKNDSRYINFRTAIWEINHPNEACPPMSTWLVKADGDESDDEDFEVGGATQNYRCSMTLRPYVDAMQCVECKHSYSAEAILGLIEQGRRAKKPVKCPMPGCSVTVNKDKLKANKELQRRSDEYHRRAARREEEAEDDDGAVEIDE